MDTEDLKKRTDDIEHTLKFHKHTGTDQTQSLGLSTTYGGRVTPTASSSTIPSGWTVSVNGTTKVYTVTHNLGTTSYSVVATAIDSNALTYYIPFLVFNANTFTIEFDTALGVPGETDWTFILIRII